MAILEHFAVFFGTELGGLLQVGSGAGQNIAKEAMVYIASVIRPGMALTAVRTLCEEKMRSLGADSFWYWDVGAFVFAGDETNLSVSGRDYATSGRTIGENDIVTVDLSPQVGDTWGDYARTIVLEDGGVIWKTEEIGCLEWRAGLETEERLHAELVRFASPETTLEQLYEHINALIEGEGFVNLDFAGNLGHSIARCKEERIYIEKGKCARLGEAGYFTFEPHIGKAGSKYGFKREDIYYFENGALCRL